MSDFQALTFDCYGTLIDWESGIWDALQPLISRTGSRDVTRDVALAAFAEIESEVEASAPDRVYTDILVHVHQRLAEHFQLPTDPDLDAAFGASIGHWPAFPDTADALRALQRQFKLVILSNVSRAGFAASNRKLGVTFDAIYTAEDIGSYKPSLRNFEYMMERLRVDHSVSPESILHTAQSLYHDHAPAGELGLARAWIDRQDLSAGGSWGATRRVASRPKVEFTFPTLMAMAEAATGS